MATALAITDRANFDRNEYQAYLRPPDWVRSLADEAETAGVYTLGIASVRRAAGPRGTAVNLAVYGWDAGQELAVVQIRECQFRAGRSSRVRKDYYLLGHTEDGAVFAHPIESPLRSSRAMQSPEKCVEWVLSQIWDCPIADLPDIRRQGDVAFVPATLPDTAKLLIEQEITIRGSHVIRADRIYRDGDTYYVTRRARATHTTGEHEPVRTNGVFRVQGGVRAKTWGFTAPLGD